MSFQLKKASLEKDMDVLFDICVKSFSRPFDDPARDPKDLINYLKNSQIYLVNQDNKPVASFSYKSKMDGVIDLKQMMVLPKCQNQGIGKFMMEELLKLVEGKEIKTVTHPKNSGAVILYLKYGFMITGWKDNYYGDGEPRLLLNTE